MFKYILLASLCLTVFVYTGCSKVTENNAVTDTSQYASESVDWIEEEGRFYTNNISKAQEYIPFTIIFPTYIPNQNVPSLPAIEGPLDVSENVRIEVNIAYAVPHTEAPPGLINVTECNYTYTLPDPEYDHDLEIVEIEGIEVTKTKKGFSSQDLNHTFTFKYKAIFYVIQFFDVSHDEAMKVVESMISQLD